MLVIDAPGAPVPNACMSPPRLYGPDATRAPLVAHAPIPAQPCWRATLLSAAIVAGDTPAYSGWISVCSSASVSMSHLCCTGRPGRGAVEQGLGRLAGDDAIRNGVGMALVRIARRADASLEGD